MTTIDQNTVNERTEVVGKRFHVIHPLDDVPEEKLCPSNLNLDLMHMSGARWWSLLTLRVYLIVIVLLVTYRGLDLAGVFSHAGR